jgi:hypothetical protein
MDLAVVAYGLYLAIAVPLTIWVGSTLSRNGRVFLVDVFDGNDALAEAVNKLLVVGFYLLNLGVVALYLRVDDDLANARAVVEVLSVKMGVVMLMLGVVHLLNVYVFTRIRRRSRLDTLSTPPVPPQAYLQSPTYAQPAG